MKEKKQAGIETPETRLDWSLGNLEGAGIQRSRKLLKDQRRKDMQHADEALEKILAALNAARAPRGMKQRIIEHCASRLRFRSRAPICDPLVQERRAAPEGVMDILPSPNHAAFK